MAHSLPDLPYALDSLEPHFDARTMESRDRCSDGLQRWRGEIGLLEIGASDQ